MTALKFDSDKPPMELLPPVALVEVAKVLAYGKRKYAAHNWKKGMEWGRVLGALLRHTFARISGEKNDPESGLPHAAHIACCALFFCEYEALGLGKDDLYKA